MQRAPVDESSLIQEKSIIFYDGVCALCNFFVKWVLKVDKNEEFLFCTQQSEKAKKLLSKYRVTLTSELDTVILLNSDTGKIFDRSSAFFEVCRKVGYPYKILTIFLILPKFLTDYAYNLIARNRYRIFGLYPTCPIPDSKDRHRFLLD